MRRVLTASVPIALLVVQSGVALHAQTDALGFFKNYFITGDYVVGGVGLSGRGVDGLATGEIVIEGVPPAADVVAAFLYWQVVGPAESDPDAGSLTATFKGHALRSAEGPFAKLLGTTSTCWRPGSDPLPGRATRSYRADVLRFFDVETATGKLAVNGLHLVGIPDGVDQTALGASLVVVYRDPAAPFSAIVLYDGAHAMDERTQGMVQTIGGFYDPATAAKLTHIVGGGDLAESEHLAYNGTRLGTNVFRSAAGAQWDNPTFTLVADPNRAQVTTSVDHETIEHFDCLTWSAVIYRTTVDDFDGDGLLDVWETAATPLVDPRGQPLPDYRAMGADPGVKDIFIEVGFMKTDAATAYGGIVQPAHTHQPGHDALRLVGEAFANAPTGRVNVHFDLGADYPPGPADPYIIRGAGLARGGEAIDEAITACTPAPTDAPWVCQFSAYPGTVGWKSGFRFLRDEVLGGPMPLPREDDPCDAPGATCPRRFDRNRLHGFHYALFAHALGLPKSELPCLDAAGHPTSDVDDRCEIAPNPEFHVPRTNTGIADFPGGDLLVTLGAFSDVNGHPVGSPFMQASTLMHELGHTAERRHGGEALELNCKPTYFSVMNYLYQLRGLLDDAGTPHLDYSRALGATIDEQRLPGLRFQPYRLGWFAPLAGSYLEGRVPPVHRHCNGADVLPTDPPTVRLDARVAADQVDWDADGNPSTVATIRDVNFNGRIDTPPLPIMSGSDDWPNLALNQVGVRRNVGGLYLDPATGRFAVGPLSADVGKGDLGKGDLGKGDLGKGDLGKGDLGKGDLGKGDLGKGDLGKGDLGKGDLGGGDLFLGDPNNPSGELDFETAADLARTPPNQFEACVIGIGACSGAPADFHRTRVAWTASNVGGVSTYLVYRVAGPTLVLGQTWTLVDQAAAVSGQSSYTLVDGTPLAHGSAHTYFAVASYRDGVTSDPSNLVTITGVNDPPHAADDAYTVTFDTPLIVPAPGVLANDDDPDDTTPLSAVLVSAPAHGSLTFAADGRVIYEPRNQYVGPDSFTYRATDGTVSSNVATVRLTIVPRSDTPGRGGIGRSGSTPGSPAAGRIRPAAPR
jgi:hypothetical protein